jgi:hypothetical protein
MCGMGVGAIAISAWMWVGARVMTLDTWTWVVDMTFTTWMGLGQFPHCVLLYLELMKKVHDINPMPIVLEMLLVLKVA